LFYSAIVT